MSLGKEGKGGREGKNKKERKRKKERKSEQVEGRNFPKGFSPHGGESQLFRTTLFNIIQELRYYFSLPIDQH